MLISMGSCPYCNNGHNTPCFATYTDGYKCYSCGKSKRHNNVFRKMESQKTQDIIWPLQGEWSVSNKKELYKLHFNDDLIRKFGIYEDIDGNVIIPTSTGWLLKNFKTKAKRHCGLKIAEFFGEASPIVIVEDILSAIRVSAVCRTVCLHGLFLKTEVAKDIIKHNNTIILWLDGDNRGQEAAVKIKTLLQACYEEWLKTRVFSNVIKIVSNVSTKNDPKTYSDSEIRSIIDNWRLYD